MKKSRILTIVIIVLAVAVAAAVIISAGGKSGGTLSFTVTDAKDADAIIFTSPKGDTMVVDTGLAENYDSLRAKLKARGVGQIATLIITHGHKDHIGGAYMLLKEFDVKSLVTIESPYSSEEKTLAIAMANEKYVPITYVKDGDTIDFSGIKLSVLNPPVPNVFSGDENNSSIVFRFTYGSKSFLFMGDAEKTADKELVNRYGKALASDFIKIGNHADKDSTSKALLSAVDPKFAVISGDPSDDADHVNSAVIDRIEKQTSAKIFRTDTFGDINVKCDGSSITITKG